MCLQVLSQHMGRLFPSPKVIEGLVDILLWVSAVATLLPWSAAPAQGDMGNTIKLKYFATHLFTTNPKLTVSLGFVVKRCVAKYLSF